MSVETIDRTSEDTENTADREALPETLRVIDLPEHLVKWVDGLDLPPGYGLMGGAARSVAMELLTGDDVPVRDIDVAAFSECQPDLSLADEVSARLMPDDYTFGHGVQILSFSDYFDCRDFTMNEVVVVDGQLIMTTQAEHDLRSNTIRPTSFVHDPEKDWHLHPKSAIKAVLFQAMLEQTTSRAAPIKGVDLDNYTCDITDGHGQTWTRPFFVALGFQKALEYGEDIADAFLDKLQRYGMVHAESLNCTTGRTSDQLSAFAEEISKASDFEFRGVAIERLSWLRQLASSDYSLGDLLHAVGGEELDRYREMALAYRGKGEKYTNESKY